MVQLRNAMFILPVSILALSAYITNAYAGHDEPAPTGYGVRVFLGYLYDYKPNSTQAEFVTRKLESYGVQPGDHETVVEYLLKLHAEIRADIQTGEQRIFCGDYAKRLDGLELQPVFNAYLDFTDATYARYSAIAASELSGLGYPDLIARLDENAKDAGPFGVQFNHLDDDGAEYFESERAKICL